MKFRTLILFFLFASVNAHSYAQTEITWQQDILNEVRAYNAADFYFSGCATCISKKRQRADSLFRTIPLDVAGAYMLDANYVVKYYAFLRVLELNDSIAFEYLENNITDTTLVGGWGACMSWSMHFNKLLAQEYNFFTTNKYQGISCARDNRAYIFKERNVKLAKKKRKELKKLLFSNNVSLE